jgi:putative endonuclease
MALEGARVVNLTSMFYVYILFSSSLENYYIGSTEDLQKRLVQHNSGKGNFSRKGIPWKLIVSIECESRMQAVQLEIKIKKEGLKDTCRTIILLESSGRSAVR